MLVICSAPLIRRLPCRVILDLVMSRRVREGRAVVIGGRDDGGCDCEEEDIRDGGEMERERILFLMIWRRGCAGRGEGRDVSVWWREVKGGRRAGGG